MTTTYTFWFKNTNPIPAGGFIVITLPSSITHSSLTTCTTGTTQFEACTKLGSEITLKTKVLINSGTSLSIPIGDFIVPNAPAPTDSFQVLTKTVAGNNIDKNQGTTVFLVELKCSSPCEDCTSESLPA